MAKSEDDYNKGPRSWCEKNYDSDPEYCDAVGGGKPVVKKKCGGKVHGKKKYAKGGKVRGQGCAVKGTKFSGVR